jgi:hypothetical protein
MSAQAPADLQPVELGQHQVQNDEIDPLRSKALESLLTVARLQHPKTFALERVREELLNGVLVVDEKDRGGVGHVGSALSLPAGRVCQVIRGLL